MVLFSVLHFQTVQTIRQRRKGVYNTLHPEVSDHKKVLDFLQVLSDSFEFHPDISFPAIFNHSSYSGIDPVECGAKGIPGGKSDFNVLPEEHALKIWIGIFFKDSNKN